MKLYYFVVAPNPTKARLYVAEKTAGGARLGIEPVLVDYRKNEQNSPEHLAREPFGRTPVLELDDGTCLTQSLAIMEYLEELHPEPCMIGRTPLERARVRALERVVELDFFLPIARIVHAVKSPLGLPPNSSMAEFYRGRLPRVLRVLEETLSDNRPFIAGDRPTIVDCTLQAAMQFARHGKIEIDPEFRQVRRWDDAYRRRPEIAGVLNL